MKRRTIKKRKHKAERHHLIRLKQDRGRHNWAMQIAVWERRNGRKFDWERHQHIINMIKEAYSK